VTGGLEIQQFEVGPLAENAWLVVDRPSGVAALVDPGDEAQRLIEAVDHSGARLEAIWLTHAHFDHIGAVGALRRHFAVPVWLHEADVRLFEAGPSQAAAWGIPFQGDAAPGCRFHEGEPVTLGTLSFDVLHTPGHAPGHVVLVGHGVAFVGDCLFAGSVGRSDLPLANPMDLNRSLARLAALPGDTRVLPGHGPETTIGRELRTNPFLQHLGVARR
jgi:glyoxylase-like metal-dependent hydrolase (beta-lactamase superfamily II)